MYAHDTLFNVSESYLATLSMKQLGAALPLPFISFDSLVSLLSLCGATKP